MIRSNCNEPDELNCATCVLKVKHSRYMKRLTSDDNQLVCEAYDMCNEEK